MKIWVAAWLGTLASAGLTQGEPRPAAASADPPYTSGRLTPERMRTLVAEPLDLLRSGDIAGAERALAAQLARVPQTGAGAGAGADAGDLLMSFGVSLFHISEAQDERLLGIAYMRRALDAYIAAFGRNHPEVGLTLSDIGNASLVIEPDDPPAEAEEAISEAHRIRVATLGPRNVETASSLARLAGIRGLPSRTRGDPARIDASAAMFRRAIADFGDQLVVPSGHGAVTTLLELAAMYAKNDRPDAALAAALEGHRRMRRLRSHEELCSMVRSLSRFLALELMAHGGDRQAQQLDRSERLTSANCAAAAERAR